MRILEVIQESIELKTKILNDSSLISEIERVANIMIEAFRSNKKVLFCGNGGSAADAQHLAAEFSGRFYYDRAPLNSEALHVNTSFLTAVANDYSYNEVYSRMVRASGRKGDILVGISTSGNSQNIIQALKTAKELGMITVSFSGEGGGLMREYSDYIFPIPSKDTPRVQECHIMIGHILCEIVESKLFPRQ